MRSDTKRTRLEAYKHERAAKLVQALLTGIHPRLRYSKDALQHLVAEVRRVLAGRELPDPWRIALNELEEALRRDLAADETLLSYIVEQAQLDAVQIALQMQHSPAAPETAINHAKEYIKACTLQQIASVGSQLYNAAREMDTERVAHLAEGLNLNLAHLSATLGKTELQPETPAQLIARVVEHTEWVWQGVIPKRHLILLAGREKQRGGKSTLLFGLIAHVLTGKAFMNRETNPQRVLYLSEETRETVRDKLMTFRIPDTDSLLLLTREGFRGGTRGALYRYQREIEHIVKHHRIELVIIDTFQSFSAIRGDGENSVGEVQAALAPLLKLSSQGVGVIIVHHHNKAEGEPRGSTALTGAMDVILNITRKGGEHAQNRRILEYEGRFGVGAIEYEFIPETCEYVCYGSPDESTFQAVQQQVLAVLQRATEPLTETVIREQLGGNLAQQRVNAALHALMQEAVVTRIGAGKRGSPYRYTVRNQECTESTANPALSPSSDGKNESRFVDTSQDSRIQSTVEAGGIYSASVNSQSDACPEALT